jgi:hypothetical protein
MLASLLLAALTLRTGLAMRRARQLRRAPPKGTRQSHLRFARPAVAMLAIGFCLGLASGVWLRGFEPLRSFHGILGTLALVLFVAAERLGLRLRQGDTAVRELHARLALAAVMIGVMTALAGFVLLP